MDPSTIRKGYLNCKKKKKNVDDDPKVCLPPIRYFEVICVKFSFFIFDNMQ